jgi:hypothetical protein
MPRSDRSSKRASSNACGRPPKARPPAREPYPHKDVWPYLHQVIEAFGPKRLIWGNDWVGYWRDTNEISQHDKELIFGETIRRVLRWPRPTR